MTKPVPLSRILWVAVMIAFVGAASLAVLPHSHTGVPKGHDCLLCRAQSVHPSLASETPSIVPLTLEGQAAAPLVCPLSAQNLLTSSLCRAPPLPA